MRTILGTAAVAIALASPAAAASFTIFTDRTAFESTLSNLLVETFDDNSVDAPFSVVTDNGVAMGGLWDDVVDPRGAETTFSFSVASLGFGGEWDLAGPGGQGTNIAVTVGLAGGGSEAVGTEIPASTAGTFWGFTSDTPFTSVTLAGGTRPAARETYTLDDMTISAVPLPAAVWLLGGGLIALAGFGRRRA